MCVYGVICVELGKVQVKWLGRVLVLMLNVRFGMGCELVDFLEDILFEVIVVVV